MKPPPLTPGTFAVAAAAAAAAVILFMGVRRREQIPRDAKASRCSCLPTWIEAAATESPKYSTQAGALDKAAVHALRRRLFCGAQSVSYANSGALMVVLGRGAWLFDESGAGYLDTRNNVAHVGHSHAGVAAAAARQASMVNSNTRYLHPNHVRLGAEILARSPAPLAKVFFVNSGSEANDLALRLARAYTGRKDVICVQHAYHGHTSEVINVSPYKFEKAGGGGQRPWCHVVAAPDTFRGKHRGATPTECAAAGRLYAEEVAAAAQHAAAAGAAEAAAETAAEASAAGASGGDCGGLGGRMFAERRGLSAFIVESGMSVAGVLLPPPGYLAASFAAVRAAGGVCICDEVQVRRKLHARAGNRELV